jgi:hypothetical protein
MTMIACTNASDSVSDVFLLKKDHIAIRLALIEGVQSNVMRTHTRILSSELLNSIT